MTTADLIEQAADRAISKAARPVRTAAAAKADKPAARHVLSDRFADADLVDRIFDFLLEQMPALAHDTQRVADLKAATRAEFRGEEVYIPARGRTDRQEQVAQALALFNGRNASEVARRLGVSRASVYRWIKQDGRR